MNQDPAQIILNLRREIEQYEYEYYILNAPTISDVEYDRLMKRLEALEAEYPEYRDPQSPTQRVGSDLVSGERSVAHRVPMLSLSNTYSWGEVEDFYDSITKAIGHPLAVVAEQKYDGISISVTYEGGILARAVTRGDGMRGDDVTAAVRAIRSVPLRLRGEGIPPLVEVRGEVLLPWKEFERLNAEISLENEELERLNEILREEGKDARRLKPLFANPRNAVAGTIKQLSPKVVSQRRPTIIFYYLLSDEHTSLPDSHYERLELMRLWGLQVSPHARLCETAEELREYIEEWEARRHSLDVATDGVVVKVDDYTYHSDIGYTAKSPKWAIAYKYPAESALSCLREVTFQVGRTGVVTPVGHIDPVQLSGTTVSRASLHNIDVIRELDLHLGDMVHIEKGGEIIPKITGVKVEARTDALGMAVDMPKECPACGTKLIRTEGEAATYCPNDVGCPPQIIGRIEHFASRKAMDINIGPKTIAALYERGMVENVADLYDLKEEDLMELPLFGAKSAQNLIRSIADTREVPFARVLFALGIREVGETVAGLLARDLRSMEALAEVSEERLQNISGIGPTIAEAIRSYFTQEAHQELVRRLKEAGLRMETVDNHTPTSDLLRGETVVISGTFETISREDLKDLILRHGGKSASGITGKTTLFVTGEKVGPSKLQKAKELGVRTLSEQEFFDSYPVRKEDAKTN